MSSQEPGQLQYARLRADRAESRFQRLARWTLTLLTIASLVMWPLSYVHEVTFATSRQGVVLADGQVAYIYVVPGPPPKGGIGGFVAPLWAIGACCGIPAVLLWSWRWRRMRKQSEGGMIL
jgi:hypothetical protein